MQELNTLKMQDSKRRILIYGDSGTGKTVFGGTAPKPKFLDADNGMVSLQGRDISYTAFKNDGPAIGWLNVESTIDKYGKDPECETVVLDSLTTVADIAMRYVQYVNKTTGKSPNVQDWGHQIMKLKGLINALCNLNKHVICTAHVKTDKDEITGRIWCGPSVTGKFAQQISLFFDEVYHSEVVEIPAKPSQYRLLMRASSIYIAKSRISRDPTAMYYRAEFDKLGEKLI